jgi:hypothetical protein
MGSRMAVRKDNSALVLLGRSFWIMFGPMLLTAAGLMILFNPGTGWQTGADITFLATLVAMILGRWLEYAGGEPVTGTGEPSTPAHFRRYVVATFIGGVLTWGLLNVVSNHVLA